MSSRIDLAEAKESLIQTGKYFFDRGWSLGTSSNYSVIVSREPLELVVTASGKDKGALTMDDFVVVDHEGTPTMEDQPKSSAETLLHVVAASQPEVGAVLHTHSIWTTLLSDYYCDAGGFEIEGYEMLKGLSGVTTHEYRAWFHIFENTQHMPVLAKQVQEKLMASDHRIKHGYLINRHGMYTWGKDLAEARRHVEILEFLFETTVRRIQLKGT